MYKWIFENKYGEKNYASVLINPIDFYLERAKTQSPYQAPEQKFMVN